MQKRFKIGKQTHLVIEARLRSLRVEEPITFSDLSLPFDIIAHPDLFDALNGIVYDIKPAIWLGNNLGYCLAQLSGYLHFTGARACGFAQYESVDGKIQGPWFTFVPRELVVPWPMLKSLALQSDARMQEHETQLAERVR